MRPGVSLVPAVQPPLLQITIVAGRSCRTIVSISCTFIRNEPSPTKPTTWRLGAAALAPSTNGRPTPMQPFGPGFRRAPSTNEGMYWRANASVALPSTQTIASRSIRCTISSAKRSGWIGVSSDSTNSRSLVLRDSSASLSRPIQSLRPVTPAALASAVSATSARLASATMPTAASLLWFTSDGSTSMWITLRSGAQRGGRPEPITKLRRVPTTRATSASRKAIERAPRKQSS